MIHPELGSFDIIGQIASMSSGVLGLLDLRPPSFIPSSASGLLFETHWVYWLVAAGVGVVLFFAGQNRTNRRLQKGGIALALVALVWMFSAWLVATPAERLYNAHNDLADAIKTNDIERILARLAPDFHCTAFNIDMPSARTQIDHYLKTYGVRATHITAYKSDLARDSALTRVTLITETAISPVKSSWDITWYDFGGKDTANDWKITVAHLVALNDQPVMAESPIP